MGTENKIRVIITVPNQKVVTVKQSICDKEHIYTQCNLKANKMALKELSANTYKLYIGKYLYIYYKETIFNKL